MLSRWTRSDNIYIFRALICCYNTQNCRVTFLNPHISLPMGGNCRVHCLVFTTDDGVEFLLLHNSRIFFNIGRAISSPDGSIVRTRTRHRVPSAPSAMRGSTRRGRLTGSVVRKTVRRALLRPETPLAREGPRQGARRLWAALGWPDHP
jgi:hypothetical protein